MSVAKGLAESIAGLVLLFLVFLIVTWLLMLFIGNIGGDLSYWGTLPLGTVVSMVIGAASSGASGRGSSTY